MKIKQTTWTSLITERLRATDDFLSRKMIKDRVTGINDNQLSAALAHLRKRHAIDVVVEADGTGWWFALPIGSDTRNYAVEERAPESKPRKPRKPKAK